MYLKTCLMNRDNLRVFTIDLREASNRHKNASLYFILCCQKQLLGTKPRKLYNSGTNNLFGSNVALIKRSYQGMGLLLKSISHVYLLIII